MKTSIERYNILDGKISLNKKRKKPIKILDFIESCKIESEANICSKSTFEYGECLFKIIQITNDTKHFRNKTISEIDKKMMLAKWDMKKNDLSEVDFVILIYFTNEKYINFIIEKDVFVSGGKREINFFINLNDILLAYNSSKVSEFDFYKNRSKNNEVKFLHFESRDFENALKILK